MIYPNLKMDVGCREKIEKYIDNHLCITYNDT